MRFLPLAVLFLILITELSFGQSFYAIRRERTFIGTVGTGVSSYYGELKEQKRSIDPRPNLTVGLQYYITNRVSLRADLTWFQLSGSDADATDLSKRNRNLSFVANNIELSASGAINLLPHGQRFYQRPVMNLYAFAGIGLLFSNPKAEYEGKKYALQKLETEGVHYSRFQPVIPAGLGVRVMVSPFFNITAEAGYRITFTDYLDDVSTVHKDPASFADPIAAALADRRPERGEPTVAAGTVRGNPDTNDQYFLMNLKLEYYIPDGIFWSSNNKLYRSKRKSLNRRR